MSKTIVRVVVSNEPAEIVSLVEKTLARKLKRAISEHASVVAEQTYGSLKELYGSDERPDYANRDDASYAAFFANALKKFGVNGPEDFRDEITKQRFFQYVDANWKSQDSVQANTPQIGGGSFELGTQTRLPAPATQPMPPTAVPQGNEPSVATMAPAGPSIDKNQPLGADGDDASLDAAQGQAGQAMAPQGSGIPCPHCQGTGQAQICPTCGRPMGDLDQDPDLSIGDDDQGDPDMQGLDQDPEDEQGLNGEGDEGDQFGGDDLDNDPDAKEGQEGDEEGQGDEGQGGGDEDSDDAFDDEDAYSVDPADFQGGGNGDQDGDEEGGFEQDPDLEVGDGDADADEDQEGDDEDDDDDQNDDQEEDDVPPPKKQKQFEEDFGFGEDNAEDAVFLTEAFDNLKKKKVALQQMAPEAQPDAAGDVQGLEKKVAFVQKHLKNVKNARNAMLKSLRFQRSAIKKDGSMSPERKHKAMKELAAMAQDNRGYFKQHAKKIKALHVG